MVVGVVANTWHRQYDEHSAGEVYIYYRTYMFGTFLSTIVARTSGDPLALADILRRQVWAVEPSEPVLKIETMNDVIADSIWRPRFSAWIFGALGGLALLLTSAGIYGVVAYTTALRSKEMGIRIALGATPRDVVVVVLRGAIVPLTIGLVAGFSWSLGFQPPSFEPALRNQPYRPRLLFERVGPAAGAWNRREHASGNSRGRHRSTRHAAG